jgi:replicative DNA helicase
MNATLQAVPDVAPADIPAEESLLGASMLIPVVSAVRAETRLAPEDFHLQRHSQIWAAMLALLDQGTAIDDVTVADELQKRGTLDDVGGRNALLELTAKAPAAGKALHYAKIVSDTARWKRRLMASYGIRDASLARNAESYAEAMELLTEGAAPPAALYGADRQRDLLYELMDGKQAAEFSWPFAKLNTLQSGGMRRGQLVIVSGYTNEGKSHFAAQILDSNHKQGARVCLYDNEMDPAEQAARRATRMTGVPYSTIISGKLDKPDEQKIVKHLNSGAFWPIVDIAGWSAEEICHHIRHERWDLVVVDILHNIPFSDERELAAAVARLKAAAKIVYREQDDNLEALPEGYVYFDKVRGGKLGSESVAFNPERLRFELR